MRIALIADAFPPMRSSAAVQLRDLSAELVEHGYSVVVIIPSADIEGSWQLEEFLGAKILRLKSPRTRDLGYIRRTFGELLMPFSMLRNLRKSPYKNVQWDGVVWYSPTIFLGPFAGELKRTSGCRSYLILRDIFPEWAVDMGLMGRGLPYCFFKFVERYQYSVADVIGVQAPGNLTYLRDWASSPKRRVEVLQNWLADAENIGCSIQLDKTPLAGRKIFVYAGNMGVAQGMSILLDLAESLLVRNDIGFVFVGRGSDAKFLREDALKRKLNNVLFYEEIDPTEIVGLYAQCHFGLVSLDKRHKTHNIPGKFLTYMQVGLPVLACINPGNNLESLIASENVGEVSTDYSVKTLALMAERMVNLDPNEASQVKKRCRVLFKNLFSPASVTKQIISALSDK
jgi:glycosyltransferase involved in cell wall biosynthesis